MFDKINEHEEQKQTHRYTGHFDSCQMGGGLKRWVEKVKGLRSTNWQSQNSHGHVKYSLGSIASNIVITMFGVRWVLDLLGWLLSKLYNV